MNITTTGSPEYWAQVQLPALAWATGHGYLATCRHITWLKT